MTYTTNAIILGYENRGEADRLYYLFTQKSGKMSVLAKGGQKILSKLAPHLEPPAISRVMIAAGRIVDKLAGAEIKKTFPDIRKNFHKREILFFCLKMVNLSTRPEGADEGVYKFLEEFMGFLDTPSNSPYSDASVGTGGEPTPSSPPYPTLSRKSGTGGEMGERENRISIIISFLLRFFSLIGFHPDFDEKKLNIEAVEKWVSGILERKIRIC